MDTKNDACQRFIRDSVVSSFTKICCDDAVNSWKIDIQVIDRSIDVDDQTMHVSLDRLDLSL